MTRSDFQQLAEMRIEEAKLLLDGGKWAGAYYLAGYAVECALKACIAKLTQAEDFPDKDFAVQCYTHDIAKLVKAAGLLGQRAAVAPAGSNRAARWATVEDWDEGSRYVRKTEAEARQLYEDITDATEGVLPWIKLYW